MNVSQKLSKRQQYRNLNKIVQNQIDAIYENKANSSNCNSTHTINSNAIGISASNCLINEHKPSVTDNSKLEELLSMSSETDDNDFEESSDSIIDELIRWAIETDIPRTHLNQLLKILGKHSCFAMFPKDSRTLLKTPRETITRSVSPGIYCHFGVKKGLERILTNRATSMPSVLKLLINMDGLPLAKSSGSQLWPILCSISNIDETVVFPAGAFHGMSKPSNSNEYLYDFVEEMKILQQDGIEIDGSHYSVKIEGIICDAPARAFVACIKGFNGYFGCGKCIQEGEWIESRMTFPDLNSAKRTDLSFKNKVQEDHHTGTSILETLDINMVTQMPYEYMHLVCLGTVRKLLSFWASKKSSRKIRIPQTTVNNISTALISLRCAIPKEFARKPRSLKELDRWKATELRQILLYTGPLVLQVLPCDLYNHFMVLHCAISYLCMPDINNCILYRQYAHELLKNFVKNFPLLYGEEHVTYNIHGLLHIVDDVEVFGPLDNYSSFRFENYMRKLKQNIHKSEKPLQQLSLRIAERGLLKKLCQPCTNILSKEHSRGPTLFAFGTQFQNANFPNFILTLESPNNVCSLVDGSIVIVSNFIKVRENEKTEEFLIGKKFLDVSDLYEIPCKSSRLGIYKASSLSPLLIWPLNCIKNKCISFNINNICNIFPLHHSKDK